jgi:hypothetical protein
MWDLWKLPPECFCGNRVYKMEIEFCCHLCCNSSMIFRHNRPPSLALFFVFRPLFLLADDVFPWFVCAVMTLETAAVGARTPNKWPFWFQMLQLNSALKIWPDSDFAVLPYELLLNTICIALTPAFHSIRTQNNNARYTHLMSFQCSPHKQFH